MSEPVPMSAEELERLGDEALCAGQLEQAFAHYDHARKLVFKEFDSVLMEVADADLEYASRIAEDLNRVTRKCSDVWRAMQPPPKSLEERATELRTAVDEYTESGDIARASQVCIDLGNILDRLGDREGAESAHRQAVALARQVDAAMPEWVLWAFRSLIDFLTPSEESITLAQEMAANLIERDEMYHPMRAADAAYHWAVAELRFAPVAQHRVDHAIDGVARQAIAMLDDICFHDKGQGLRRHAAKLLRCAGREADADQWQADADKYEDWSVVMDQEIPGHVHLWDIRIDLSAAKEATTDHLD